MEKYFITLNGRQLGPYTENELADFYRGGTVMRKTPCRSEDKKEWSTIDEYFPRLKYDSQMPTSPASSARSVQTLQVAANGNDVTVIDINVPFKSVFIVTLKVWLSLVLIGIPVAILFWILWMGLMAALLSNVPRFHP